MPYPLPLTRTEAYLAYKAGVIQQSDLKPSLAVPRNGIDAWLAYWTGLTDAYPVKKVGKNLFSGDFSQFDNTGGVGSLYAYFKLPDDGVYTLTLIAKNDVTGTSGTFFGFTTTGGDGTNPRNWVFYQGLTMTKGNTRSVTNVNGGVNQHYVSLYLPSSDTFQWFMDNFEIQLEKGSTATAYEPYTGGPLILQEEEAYIAYLCGVINEYPEKSLRRVGAYLRYLISARWGRPDHPLNREELYLSLIKTQVIPSGDPSSDIVIDGTAKAPFVDVKMYGDTYQQTYTGKNLFATPAGGSPSGVTFTLNPDGTYDIRGTATAQAQILIYTDTPWLENGETYTVKANQPLGDVIVRVEAYSNTSYLRTNYILNSTTQQQTGAWNGENATKCCFVLRVGSGKTVNISGLGIQLEKGSTATDFETFCGGIPAPNPSYPQPIQTVTGLQTVEVRGKNLLSSVWETGSYSTTNGGKQDVANAYRTAEKIAVQSDTTYIVSRDSAGLAMNYYEYDANGNFLAYTLKSANQSITTGQTTKFITMSRSQTGGIEKMMLESGSTITAYEPYSSNSYEINLGKNLFDKNNVNIFNGYISNTSSNQLIASSTARIVYIPCSPNTTYSISKAVIGTNNRFCIFTTNEVPASNVVAHDLAGMKSGENNATSYTITTSADAKYICAYVKASSTSATDTQIYATIQIEAGSATPYAPYFEPIELCKLGTYQDYIWKDGDSWKVHKAIGYRALSGTEDWIKYSYSDGIYYASIDSLSDPANAEFICYSANYKGVVSSSTIADFITYASEYQYAMNVRRESKTIRIKNTDIQTADALKTWLRSNPTSVYYPVATPTDTVVTNQALIDQLEALVAGGAENGTTYIKVNATDPNLPGLLYVEAPKYE